ncbi:MAG: 4-hydroxy-tetrahydrodipicolinate reductase, partial [Deltaproteobacteria bacterium]|nr:4-hydroxy-tetrahydrodipicolinate reductase [Deltaproteobacteria bacterium]
MTKAIVAGAAGRMGIRLIHMIHQSQKITLAAAFEHPEHPSVNMLPGTVARLAQLPEIVAIKEA